MKKVYTDAAAALAGLLHDDMMVMCGGFGLVGIPDKLIHALRDTGAKDLTCVSNNAGIDDSLIGGVIDPKYTGYNLVEQWTSYGWNVFAVENGNDYGQVVAGLRTLEQWDPADRRPMVLIGKTVKGYWPVPVEKQLVGFPSHPYAQKINSDYFVALAKTFEDRYGVPEDQRASL